MEIRPDFADLLRDDSACRSLAERVSSENGVPFRGRRILEGSTILFRTGHGHIIKIFSSEEPEFCSNEASWLRLLQNRLPVRVPRLKATGTFSGYPYIIMEEITDLPLKRNWKKLSPRNRRSLMVQIADLLRELHSIPLREAPSVHTDWSSFISGQKENLESNHRGFGLGEARLEEVIEFVRDTPPVESTSPGVLCHTEIMLEHLFMRYEKGRPRLTALIDFEPSMQAVPEYDMCAVGVFVSQGERGLFKRFLKGYGHDGNPNDTMRMLLLHRYSNLKWFISTLPSALREASLGDLARFWFS